jgi:hypothetical protein
MNMGKLSGLIFSAAVLGMVAVAPAQAQTCGAAVTAAQALAAEDARYAAQTDNDFAAMEKLFGEDLVYIHSSSAVDGKASYIESMRSGAVTYRVMNRSDVKVRTYGCIAILTGKADFEVTVRGEDLSVALAFHSVWARHDRGLEFISWQATRIPPKP